MLTEEEAKAQDPRLAKFVQILRLAKEHNASDFSISYEESEYRVRCKKVLLDDIAKNSEIIDEEDFEGYLIAVYFFECTVHPYNFSSIIQKYIWQFEFSKNLSLNLSILCRKAN